MVDHCPAEKILEHFLEFTGKINLDLKLMLHIGMGEPSVNLKFEDLLKSLPHIKSLGTTILSIRTWPLHIVHNAFRAVLNALNFILLSTYTFSLSFLLQEEKTTNKCRNIPMLFHISYRNIPAQDELHRERYVLRYWSNTKICKNSFWNSSQRHQHLNQWWEIQNGTKE